jgi:hypothetical protein
LRVEGYRLEATPFPEIVSEYLTEGNATKLSSEFISIREIYKNNVKNIPLMNLSLPSMYTPKKIIL